MPPTLYTIGHSNHAVARFLELLEMHRIQVLCDVRSHPYSRFNPQFNRKTLAESLCEANIAYLFLGRELGARSDDPSCLERGRVRYDRIAGTPSFRHGLERLREESTSRRVAIMCAEKDPLECHRTILVARRLDAEGLSVQHIHSDGSLEAHEETVSRLLRSLNLPERDLFRSREEVVADAYAMQEERISYEPAVGETSRSSTSRSGPRPTRPSV